MGDHTDGDQNQVSKENRVLLAGVWGGVGRC